MAIRSLVLMLGMALAGLSGPTLSAPGMNADEADGYQELVDIYTAFRAGKTPKLWSAAFDDPDAPYGFADYSAEVMQARLNAVNRSDARLKALDPTTWPSAHKVDYLVLKSQLAKERFYLEVSRPWARDPGTYVDPLLRLAFSDMTATGVRAERIKARLQAVPDIIKVARSNLTEGAADYLMLARFNMRHPDGVGHGHPFRAVPPEGVIGWYQDLVERAGRDNPAMLPVAQAALQAIRDFADWLDSQVPVMTAHAGVGSARFDWYMRHAKLLPWNSAELKLLAEREWARLLAFLALEEKRNRDLPALTVADSREEYRRRLRATDKNVRDWLVDADILTLPDETPDFDTFGYNAPYIERKTGLNFWEKVQFRDPHPDHLHAVIPGHRYDGWYARRSTHPIRSNVSDGVRVEGWAVYLEEPMVRAGVLDHAPRVHELMYLFGIFRATRVGADIGMQLNQMTIPEGAAYMKNGSPWLDDDVARVDAEIYLRRPPGYGLGYTIGNLQIQQLLGEARVAAGDDFDLKDFHDTFLDAGRIPISLIRYEMLGKTDQIEPFWAFEPIPAADRETP
jgi:hypothetical protein